MKKFKILFIVLVLFISVSASYAEGNFTSLQTEINNADNSIEITQNYIYDNSTDYQLNNGITINKTNFYINGNGHTIDGASQARIFNCLGENITIFNLKLINAFSTSDGGAIKSEKLLYCNNVSFMNNIAEQGSAIYCNDIKINNSEFNGDTGHHGAVYCRANTIIENSNFLNLKNMNFSFIYGSGHSFITINNCSFLNSTSKYATAIYSCGIEMKVKNSIFSNLHAQLTSGAIALKDALYINLENCIFSNISSSKNGGVIFNDAMGKHRYEGYLNITNSSFTNCTGDFGGAIVQLGGILNITNSNFTENHAIFDGGAIYLSFVRSNMNNVLIDTNELVLEFLFNGGGIYLDKSSLNIKNSIFTENSKNAIYAYDSKITAENIIFEENNEAVHSVFSESDLKNSTLNNDTLYLNDTNYVSYVESLGLEINPINNTIDVNNLPTRYDSRDWGWVSPIKRQGQMGSCWTFGACGALESALLKATGKLYDFSENNLQNSMLQYSENGIMDTIEGGIREQALEYFISWIGVFPEEYDEYDELGKLSPVITTDNNIHVLDAIFVPSRKNSTDNDALKKAILKCGSVNVGYRASLAPDVLNPNTSATYQTKTPETNHAVALVGWDDNYSAKNFVKTPPGDGAFIIKNSWGEESGDHGYYYISYYDISLVNYTYAIGYLFENTEKYTKNYQTDLGGHLDILDSFESYKNTYTSYDNDLISAVGTYFNDSENYTIEIYVNDELKHTQNGTAPYYGYHTVKLTDEIPIKSGDNFTVVMTKNTTPMLFFSRQHYRNNMSFVKTSEGWKDTATNFEPCTVSLKVYTKPLSIFTQDLVKIYKNDTKFEANIGVANETVTFEINGKKYDRISDENGFAKIAINLNPGNYTIKTTYDDATVENNIEVLPTLIAENLVKYFRNASQFNIRLIDGAGNSVPNANITMNINGVFYNRTTNENGTARLNINLNPGEYVLTAVDPLTGLQMSYNITVLPTMNATDLEMTYKDGSTFNVSVVDGQGNPLVNAAITFNINGVFYTRYTSSEGIAKLNINLMAGKYIITSEYDGLRISNTITIKD
ncbi:C1 family peptidase [Methanobrevibacter sp.]|uniref:C1 family peptidase n=1 Tax=Methanobrevibacter sp. TaxID=66852 RepID=UPI00388FCF90